MTFLKRTFVFILVMAVHSITAAVQSPDFFILESNQSQRFFTLSQGFNCRENIRKVMCLVEPTKEGESAVDRKCLAGSKSYSAVFEQLHDQFPPTLQKMFCSLTRIYIEKQTIGTAYAGIAMNPDGTQSGVFLGVRKSVLEEAPSLSQWASWKEQLSFGGSSGEYRVSPTLPNVYASTKAGVNSFLYFLIAHEFGHLFDFANQLNEVSNCPDDRNSVLRDPTKCALKPGTWGSISWVTDSIVKPKNEFQHREGLCFYLCKEWPLSPKLVHEIYESWAQTDFISLYATTQPWDDFADSLAYYLLAQDLEGQYLIDTKQGRSYDVIRRLHSPLFARKKAYLRQFLQRSDLRYP